MDNLLKVAFQLQIVTPTTGLMVRKRPRQVPLPGLETYFSTIQTEIDIDDLNTRRRLAAGFCHVTRAFFLGLPTKVAVALLVLDADHVILDVILAKHCPIEEDQFVVQPGYRLNALLGESSVPYVQDGANPRQLELPHLFQGWRASMIGVRHGAASESDKHFVFLSNTQVPIEALHDVALTSSHAIAQLHERAVTESMESQNTIESTQETVDAMALEMEKVTSLASLSAGIAHEIRNPLTTARGFLQLFEQRCSPADKPYLELTIRELDRVHALLADFMNMVRPQEECTQTVDARDIVLSVYQFLGPEASLCDVELTLDVPDRVLPVSLQPSRIKQVLLNLLQNAVHACKSRGHVKLSLADCDSKIILTIADNGCGIADPKQLFRPFHTTKASGTGLGMFVSKHIIEQHNGEIHIDSAVNVGTTVTIWLPK